MAAAVDQRNYELTYLDVDRTAQRVMAPAGLKYWLWVGFCAFRPSRVWLDANTGQTGSHGA